MPHTHDHELKIDSTTDRFYLVKGDDGRAMYQVIEDIPEYQRDLRFTQFDWKGGHGQHTFRYGDMYYQGASIDTTEDGIVALGPLATQVLESDDTQLDSYITNFFWAETAGKLICSTNAAGGTGNVYLYGTKWTVATDTIAGVLQFAEFDGKVYAAMGSTTAYEYTTDCDDWTTSTLAVNATDKYANGFLVAPNSAGTGEVLWKFIVPNKIYSAAAPVNGATGTDNWSSAIYVGDTTTNIINMFLNGNKLYVGKENGLFWVDANGAAHQILELPQSTYNFKWVCEWQGSTYFSVLNGMAELTVAGTYRLMGPRSDTDGILRDLSICGIASDKDFLYVHTLDYPIYKGREVLRGNELRWEWCPWVTTTSTPYTPIAVIQHTTTDTRLWFGNANFDSAWAKIVDHPTAPSSGATYTTAGWLRMSYTYGSNPIWDKLWQSVVLECEGLASGETVQIKYRDDNDTTATECVATATIGTTNGVTEHMFATALANKRIQFEIHLASDTSSGSPKVRLFQAKGTEKPTTVRTHEAYYRVGDRPSDRAKTIRALLRTARTSTTLIKFADLRYGQKTSGTSSGDYVWCVMEPGYPKEVEIAHAKGMQPELAIMVRLKEVSFTIS